MLARHCSDMSATMVRTLHWTDPTEHVRVRLAPVIPWRRLLQTNGEVRMDRTMTTAFVSEDCCNVKAAVSEAHRHVYKALVSTSSRA